MHVKIRALKFLGFPINQRLIISRGFVEHPLLSLFLLTFLATKVSAFEVPYGKDWITETSPSIFQISGQPAVLPTCQLDFDSWTCRWFQA